MLGFQLRQQILFTKPSTPSTQWKTAIIAKMDFHVGILFQPHENRRFLDFTQPGLWRFYRSTVTQNVALAARGAALGVRRSGRAKLRKLLHGHRGSCGSGGGTDETGDSVERKIGNDGNKIIIPKIVFYMETSKNQPPKKGDSFWKPTCLGSMLNFWAWYAGKL